MPDDGAAVATGVFGGITCCILVCLFTIGIPMFITGIALLVSFSFYEPTRTAGIVCVVLSSLLIVAGIVTGIITCVCAVKTTKNSSRRNNVHPDGMVVLAPGAPQQFVYTSAGNQQQPIYHTTVAQAPVPPPYNTTQPQAPQDPQAPQPGQSAYPDTSNPPPAYDYVPQGVATKPVTERY